MTLSARYATGIVHPRRRPTRWPVTALIVAILIAAGVAAALSAPAGAVVTSTAGGHAVSYQPTAAEVRAARALSFAGPLSSQAGAYKQCAGSDAVCLTYYGGPVMQTVTLTPVFWNPENKLKYPSGYEAEIEQFFTGLKADSEAGGETNFYSVLPQYYDTLGGIHHISYSVGLGTPIHDSDALPSASADRCTTPFEGTSRLCVQDEGVRAELASLIAKESLPTGLGHEYVVFFPEGIDSCFNEGGTGDPECSGTGYCGYHGTVALGGGKQIQYANEPDNGDPAYRYEFAGEEYESCSGRKGLEPAYITLSSTSHEISESITDPEVGEPELSWYDPHELNGSQYGEIGDICAYEYEQGEAGGGLLSGKLVTPVSTSNQTIDGHAYLLQDEWDNEHNTCSIAKESASTSAKFTDSALSAKQTGESISFDAGGSHGPSNNSAITGYEWQWGDGTTSSSGSPTIKHTYTSSEGAPTRTFTVTLVVTDQYGNTASVEHTLEILDRPPTASFTAPAGATAGALAQFDGSASSDPDGAIAQYKWSFGDGSSATGSTPAHVYAKSGEYTVTLEVTDDAGKTDNVSHPVVVGAAPPSKESSTTSTTKQSSKSTIGAAAATIRVTGVKQNKKRGTAALSISVSTAGLLSVGEAGGAHLSLASPIEGALAAPTAYPVALSAKAKAKAKGPFVKSISVHVDSAGTTTLQITPTTAGKSQLGHKHKLTVKLLIIFAPNGGSQVSVTQAVTLALAAKHK